MIKDFTERRQFRRPESVAAKFTADEIHRAERALERYRRHTVDLSGPAPQHVEDEALAFERGYRRAKVAWCVLLVLVTGYVVWRLWQ